MQNTKFLPRYLLLAACSVSSMAFSANEPLSPFFIELGGGYSWSMDANVHTDADHWGIIPEGLNSKLGQSEYGQIALGFQPVRGLALDISGSYRPSYKYNATHARTVALADETLTVDTAQVHNEFNLRNASVMFGVSVNKRGDAFAFNLGNGSFVAPYVGFGAGVAYNTMSDFKSSTRGLATPAAAATLLSAWQDRTLAAQGSAGIVASIASDLLLEVGYRYFYGGDFKSGEAVNLVPGTDTRLTPWTGALKAHEAFVGLSASF